jgi:prefoldin subunit 5
VDVAAAITRLEERIATLEAENSGLQQQIATGRSA